MSDLVPAVGEGEGVSDTGREVSVSEIVELVVFVRRTGSTDGWTGLPRSRAALRFWLRWSRSTLRRERFERPRL